MVTRFLTIGAAALAVAKVRQRVGAAVHAKREATHGDWLVIESPFGPGTWLTERGEAEIAHAFVPPGTRASHDEPDRDRQRWRHLTIDAERPWERTVTVLDMNEVQKMVPSRAGWVLVQTIRYSDGTVGTAELLASIHAVGVEPAVLDGALRILGGTEKLRVHHFWGAARMVGNVAAHIATAGEEATTSEDPLVIR